MSDEEHLSDIIYQFTQVLESVKLDDNTCDMIRSVSSMSLKNLANMIQERDITLNVTSEVLLESSATKLTKSLTELSNVGPE